MTEPAELGLFVPKPSRHADCQGRHLPDLGATVRQRPRMSTGERGDRYSLGYSVAQDCVAWFRYLINCLQQPGAAVAGGTAYEHDALPLLPAEVTSPLR